MNTKWPPKWTQNDPQNESQMDPKTRPKRDPKMDPKMDPNPEGKNKGFPLVLQRRQQKNGIRSQGAESAGGKKKTILAVAMTPNTSWD